MPFSKSFKEKDADTILQEAQLAYGEGRIADAIAGFEEAASRAESHQVKCLAHLGLGRAHVDKEMFPEAIASFKKAIEIDPLRVEAHVGMADGLMKLERIDEAIAGYKVALSLSPDDASINRRLETAKLLKDYYGRAEDLAKSLRDRGLIGGPGVGRPVYRVGEIMSEIAYTVMDVKEGGMGIVYIAAPAPKAFEKLPTEAGKILTSAIKTFKDEFLTDEEVIKRFYKEAETWVKLGKHRNIVSAKSVLVIDARPHIMMEYVDGGSLRDGITEGRLDLRRSLDYAIQFCEGMIYVHNKDLGDGERGVVHRDIKPGNIMLTKKEVVKITDFGLVKALGTPSAEKISGTPEYMSPEQFQTMDVDKRSDIYSFGVVLYQMLTGRLPFYTPERDPVERWRFCKHHHQEVQPEPPGQIDSSLPGDLARIVLKCLEKKPERRYQSFAELRDELIAVYERLYGRLPERVEQEEIPYIPMEVTDFDRAMSLFNLRLYEDSLPLFDEALKANPYGIMGRLAWCHKGKALGSLGRFGEAISCFEEALKIDPHDFHSWMGKAEAYREMGLFDKSVECYDKALEVNPNDVDALNHKGYLLLISAKYQEALPYFDRVLTQKPEDFHALVNKGSALSGLDRHEEALECFDKALQMDPNHAEAWLKKGVCLIFLNRLPEALRCVDRTLEIDPSHPNARRIREMVLSELG